MIKENRHFLVVASIMGVVFAVTAVPCHGESPQSWSVKAVYARTVASSKDEPNYALNRDLFMQRLPGGEPVRITDWARHPLLDKGMYAPQLSPDGNYVLFMGHLKNHKPIMPQNDWPSYPWVVDVRTRTPKLVGQTKDTWYLSAAWLPDQQGIVARVVYGKKPQFGYYADLQASFVMSGGETHLVMIDIKTGKEVSVKRNVSPGLFWVLPINRKIITYDWGDDKLTLYNLSTGKWRTLLKSAPLDVAEISPDGKGFAYYHKGVLRVCNIQTGKVRILYNARDTYDKGGKLIWSPNGKWIAVRHSSGDITSVDPPVASSTSYLTLVDADSGKSRLLLKDSRDIPIGWTNDGKNILLKQEEKADGVFPCDAKVVLKACPISAISAEPSSTEVVGHLTSIDILTVPE